MLDVLDAILNTIEPGGAIGADDWRPSTSGTKVDHAGAKPFEVEMEPDRLYGWLIEDRHSIFEVGNPPSQREDFAFSVLYVAEAGEQARQRRGRALSAALDGRAHLYLERLAALVSNVPTWEHLTGELDSDTVQGFSVRGFGLRLEGHRYFAP